ncbi:hypothetical protein [Nitrosomonas eutropha]|uniref:hypothetical protein n=1 Tax=Nitrosomonas eutropha TaxID=916 RepID=UPI0008CA8DB7|nr:hypothetical protein [Nitrosomonas eutropha]SEJ22360.1 Beta-barrel assembly machine subunit BamE [Nitrosomonas eutropha]
MKKITNMFLTMITLTVLSGCSVGMALSGKQDPDLRAIRVGATRGEIELHLGHPITTTTLEDRKRQDIYEYELGNEADAGRAIGHGVMDVLTLGLWEVIGTPIEAMQGHKRQITITYDKKDHVQSIVGTAPKRQF